MSIPTAYIGIILIWSTTPLAIKWSSEGPGYLFGVTGRMLIGVILCIVLVNLFRIKMQWHKEALHTYIAAGLAVYGAMVSVYWGSQYIPSGLVSVLFGLTPFVTGLFAAVLLNERSFTFAKILGMLTGLSGLVLIFRSNITTDDNAIAGIYAVLISVCIHSVSSVWVKRIGAELPALVVVTGALLVATPLYLLTWWFQDGVIPEELPAKAMMSILYLGVFGSALGFILFYYALKQLQAGTMAMITMVTPVTALVLGSQLNHEIIDGFVWLGALCVIAALVIYQWGDRIFSTRTEKEFDNLQ